LSMHCRVRDLLRRLCAPSLERASPGRQDWRGGQCPHRGGRGSSTEPAVIGSSSEGGGSKGCHPPRLSRPLYVGCESSSRSRPSPEDPSPRPRRALAAGPFWS